MTDTAADDASTQTFFFIRGVEEDAGECEWPDDAEKVRQALGESLNAKNVAFLLGAGCSSSRVDDREVGVPTMAPLAKEFTQSRETDDASFPTTEERELLLQQFGVDISAEEYSRNPRMHAPPVPVGAREERMLVQCASRCDLDCLRRGAHGVHPLTDIWCRLIRLDPREAGRLQQPAQQPGQCRHPPLPRFPAAAFLQRIEGGGHYPTVVAGVQLR